MSTTPSNSDILLQRIEQLEAAMREKNSVDAVKAANANVLSREKQIDNIFRGTGDKVQVPDRGLKYPKYVGHPWRKDPDGQPHHRTAHNEFDEAKILEEFNADVNPADESAVVFTNNVVHENNTIAHPSTHSHEAPTPKRRGRPAKKVKPSGETE